MAKLDFDKRREERGVTEDHEVTFGGEAHSLPAVLPLEVMAKVAVVFKDLVGEDGDMAALAEGVDMAQFMAAVPGLVDVFAEELGEWIRRLDMDEFMDLFGLYDLGVSVGEASAS